MSRSGSESSAVRPSPWVVALAGWLAPGLGYWLIGQRARGITAGATIVVLFLLGLLIGGVRVLEAPMYNRIGERIADVPLTAELQAKPWSVAQVMAGPVAIVSGGAAVYFARLRPVEPGQLMAPLGVESHARINEIGVLYTAVAGMLNLLIMIDSGHRAAKLAERA